MKRWLRLWTAITWLMCVLRSYGSADVFEEYLSPDARLALELSERANGDIAISVRDKMSGKASLLATVKYSPLQGFIFAEDNSLIVVMMGNPSLGTGPACFRRIEGVRYKRIDLFGPEDVLEALKDAGALDLAFEANHAYLNVTGFRPPHTLELSIWGNGIISTRTEKQGSILLTKGVDYDLASKTFRMSKREPPLPNQVQWSGQKLAQYGTGFFISADGFLVTCNHVIDHASLVKLVLSNSELGTASVIASDEEHDIALLQAHVNPPAVCYVSADVAPQMGSSVSTIGFPTPQLTGFAAMEGAGTIRKLSGYEDEPWQIQVSFNANKTNSVLVNKGDSGGAIMTESGAVVGMIKSILSPLRLSEEDRRARRI